MQWPFTFESALFNDEYENEHERHALWIKNLYENFFFQINFRFKHENLDENQSWWYSFILLCFFKMTQS